MGVLPAGTALAMMFRNDWEFLEEDFWIDTGAHYSYVPSDKLEVIGIEPTSTRRLALADGRTEKRLFGYCDFTINGIEGEIHGR